MRCTFLPGGTVVCGVRQKISRCIDCNGKDATLLCDGPPVPGSTSTTHDVPICIHCACHVGENLDLCTACAMTADAKDSPGSSGPETPETAGAGTGTGSPVPDAGAVPPVPPVHEPARCKGKNCGAAIFWVMRIDSTGEIVRVPPETGRPKSFPVDVEPTDKGNVEIFARGKSLVGWTLSRVAADEYRAKCVALKTKPRLRMPHHATCPDRAMWGRK